MKFLRTLVISRWGRGLLALLLVWVFVMIMAAKPMFTKPRPDDQTEYRLSVAFKELELLKTQNEELKNLFKDISLSDIPIDQTKKDQILKSINDRILKVESLQPSSLFHFAEKSAPIGLKVRGDGPSTQYEMTRRQIHSNVKEMWNFLNSEVKSLQKGMSNENNPAYKNLNYVLSLMVENKRWLLSDIERLPEYDGYEGWRQKESQELSDLVQARFNYLQNPKDCSKAQKLVCNLNKGCGFGCQLHHVVYCLIIAYGTERTLILNSRGWRYNKAGWEDVFLPLSETCIDSKGSSYSAWPGKPTTQVLSLPIIDSISPRPPFLPLAVPEDLAERLQRIHGDPIVWWIGQLMKYLLRPTKRTQEMINDGMNKLGFQKPIVGVHVRRTDKVGTEAAFHGIDEYMNHVDDYYKQLEMTKSVERRVYLATDDPKVIDSARVKYPNYNIIGDPLISKTASVSSRYSDGSLQGVILDIMLLAHSDYLVCTFSSQVCRVAYEIMQTMHVDASDRFKSLDDIYYYGGQSAHSREAVLPHRPARRGEIHLNPGDLVGVAGNHWDGYSKGENSRTSESGLFPSFKVKDKMVTASFPTYPQVI